MKKFLITILILATFIGAERLFYICNEGFRYSNIISNIPSHKEWNVQVSSHDLQETKKALFQEYSYLSSGGQSYVFISSDQSYILKFFKHKHWRLNPFLYSIPLPKFINSKREKLRNKKKEILDSTFGSCITAYTHFKNETGLFYIHLNKTKNLNHTLTVIDKMGYKHKIDLDEMQFLLQYKAIQTDEYLLNLKNIGDTEGAQKAIQDLFQFQVDLAKKGYNDKDPHLIRNFGFINSKVVEIDVGGFYQDPKKDLNYFYNHEIYRIQNKIIPWLNKHYPELRSYAEEQLQEIVQKNFSSI